jgi:hypothetical protein
LKSAATKLRAASCETLSQVPMLALMMAYTILGLWVISLPFALTGRG